MVNAGRVACLFTPFALSTAALVCILLVFLGGWSEHNNTLGAFYFFKADLSNFTSSGIANLAPSDSSIDITAIEGAFNAAKQSGALADYYTVYLENYCSWNGNDKYSYCSPRKAHYVFDPIEIWGLNSTLVEPFLPKTLTDGVDTYKKLAGVVYTFYVIAIVCTGLVLLLGFSALFSRWGSFFTTGIATLAGISCVVSSAMATALYAVLVGAINDSSFGKDLGIHTSLGQPALRITWFAVLFSCGAWVFWLFSICCCSARSPYKGTGDGDSKRFKVEKTPYTYERVGSPYLGPKDGQNVPLQTFNNSHQPQYQAPTQYQQQSAYEPFRPQQI